MTPAGNDIAVIGMAARFPGADNVWEFWDNIKNGAESIRFFSEEELAASNISWADIKNENYVKAKGELKDAALFAASFFGYSPHDAKLMDPQHRILLEISFLALENAGVVPDHYSGQIGAFVSTGFNTYLLHCLAVRPELGDAKNHYQCAVANGNDFLATRLAYKLNLTGPAQTIQTACSSSLVAIHTACQNLLNYECDAALAGGVCITSPLASGYLYKKDGIGSPDGHCRPFDKDAAGTVPGNGAGIVVLKRLEDAVADSDHIYAVIKSSAINNDGSKKISYTAPSIQGQEQVIRTAHALACIASESIGYIEAHGTGTSLGDPIEIEALTRAFDSGLRQFCAIGSVKANIGHLDTAAGVAGFIKTVLMLHHCQLPPQINFAAANPRIPFAASPFYVNTGLKPWALGKQPRRAGVSAFGIGGTNAHVVLEEYIKPDRISEDEAAWHMLPLSGETHETINSIKTSLLAYLEKNPHVNLADAAYSLQQRRRVFSARACILAKRHNGFLHFIDATGPNDGLSALQNEQLKKWLAGEDNAWLKTDGFAVSLPTYPFHREHYWISGNVTREINTPQKPSAMVLPLNPQYRTDIEDNLTVILKELLETDSVSPQDNFDALGVDSLMSIDLSLLIEERMGYKISTGDFYTYPTVQKISEFMRRQGKKSPSRVPALPSLAVEIQTGQPGAPVLFCIHPAGGNVAVFQEIAVHIDDTYRLIGIRSKGWDGKEPPDATIDAMAETYIKVIRSIQKEGPYYLCGSSIGGTVAFEIARRLTEMHEEIALLALLDSPASLNEDHIKVPDTRQDIQHYIQTLCPQMSLDLERLEQRDKAVADIFYTLWKSHALSIFEHAPLPQNIAMLYFSAAEKSSFLPKNLLSEWVALAEGGIEIHNVAGNHLSMNLGKGAKHIAKILNRKMESHAPSSSHIMEIQMKKQAVG